MNNTIYIIGAGAVGKTLAVSLSLEGKKVVLLRGRIDNGSSFTETITVIYNGTTRLEASVNIDTISNFENFEGLVVLTNKSYGNKSLAKKLVDKSKDTPLVILQNGLNIEQPFIDEGFSEVYRCVLFMTGQINSSNEISYKPVAVSPIGTIKSSNSSLTAIVESLISSHFEFRAENNIQKIIWEKAIANSVFNSICPLLEADNGIFHRQKSVLKMAQRVIAECHQIATLKGVTLNIQDIEQRVLQISEKSDGQLISTLQDIKNGRKTEIDTLNLEFSRIASELGMENGIKETSLLGELVKIKSEASLKKYKLNHMPTKEFIENFIRAVEELPHDQVIKKFYADDASIQENQGEPRIGIDSLIENERNMLKKARKVKSECIRPFFHEGKNVVIRWKFQFEWLDGSTTQIEEMAHQTWKGDKIYKEQFFYDPKQFIPKKL
ncbi:2-dehydropantoate 2-reductase [Flagellimonas sp. S174]|uniref:2-dehydropantoate 2-reductase n=1 Tax=Flagellimonas sp. S174 TaxID=3410790 RepID=UPI003BF56DB0